MIRVAIVEDESAVAENLAGYLARYGQENGRELSVTRFDNALKFLSVGSGNFEVVLMDIELPDLDGMSAVAKLRETDGNVLVIFVTNLAQYAVKGYEVNAFDFIVKPVSYYNFALKIGRAIERLGVSRELEIWVSTRHGKKLVTAGTLKYVEVMKHVLIYHTTRGDVTGSGTLRSVLEITEGLPFALCNQCYLVNLRYVTEIKDYKVIVGGDTLQISSPKRKEFIRALNNYLGGGANA